ncbi:hypothetical protein PR003_g15851 [Phytophthora rubi]|uniref:Uncharacterized protein n=1 Tax=Phytophthora rubi TaxID=129364 RepID=A0A6A4F4X9_9STRA|nr:hypothetical protein PR002_g14628 [Phytophthora rubi]KAE9328167.1 hypothetical protein PR003_g15851 [Phytophthora rubi]
MATTTFVLHCDPQRRKDYSNRSPAVAQLDWSCNCNYKYESLPGLPGVAGENNTRED